MMNIFDAFNVHRYNLLEYPKRMFHPGRTPAVRYRVRPSDPPTYQDLPKCWNLPSN